MQYKIDAKYVYSGFKVNYRRGIHMADNNRLAGHRLPVNRWSSATQFVRVKSVVDNGRNSGPVMELTRAIFCRTLVELRVI